jgi:tripartite-type tricarboxylate transporter receptor subunit TctC
MRILSLFKRWFVFYLLALAASAALAQKFPTTSIKLLVGTPPGGTTDIMARLMAQKMSDVLGQQVVVENKSGASGLIAAETVSKASPDGYTLLMAPAQLATYKALYPTTTLDAEKDLEPLGIVATTPYVMVVHPTLPVKTLPELIAYARANPGKLSLAGSTPGGAQHLSWELIKRRTNVDMQYVPYRGTGALMPDLLSGRLQAGIDNIAVLTPYVKSGQLRGIAVTSANKTALLPDLPPIALTGTTGMGDFQAIGWFGVFVASKVPPEVLAALRAAIRTVMAQADMRERLTNMGAEPQSGSSDEMRALLRREITVWTKVIQDSNITVQ